MALGLPATCALTVGRIASSPRAYAAASLQPRPVQQYAFDQCLYSNRTGVVCSACHVWLTRVLQDVPKHYCGVCVEMLGVWKWWDH